MGDSSEQQQPSCERGIPTARCMRNIPAPVKRRPGLISWEGTARPMMLTASVVLGQGWDDPTIVIQIGCSSERCINQHLVTAALRALGNYIDQMHDGTSKTKRFFQKKEHQLCILNVDFDRKLIFNSESELPTNRELLFPKRIMCVEKNPSPPQ